MAITTYAAFVDSLRDTVVTGITRRYEEPPASVTTADLPASWPMLPIGNEPMLTGGGTAGGWAELICDLVIAVEPLAQGTQAQNYALMITIMDNLSTALRGRIGAIGRGGL